MEVSRQNLFAIRQSIVLRMTTVLTPGSVTDACTNDDIQIKNKYAKKTGTAGDTWCEKYGPLDDISAKSYWARAIIIMVGLTNRQGREYKVRLR